MKKIALIILFFIIQLNKLFAQERINFSFIKRIQEEIALHKNVKSVEKSYFNLIFNKHYYINTNLPNFQNKNGLYFPKGFGSYKSFLFFLSQKHLILSIEPQVFNSNEYEYFLPVKEKTFSVLNDVPLEAGSNNNYLKNLGFVYKNNYLSLGYGNWNQWWGPGIHNSLVLSNNSKGYNHFFISSGNWKKIANIIDYKVKYSSSSAFRNQRNFKYFLTNFDIELKLRNIEFGLTKHIVSGGRDIHWNSNDAIFVHITKKNINYWTTINDFYVSYNNNPTGLRIFFEYAVPRGFFAHNELYYDNSNAINLGFRKYGAFGNNNLLFGFEYARLLQGTFYNTIATSNWYDEKKYNYMSYRERRWGPHGGTDSDDILSFFGYNGNHLTLLYSLNFERHGVAFNFPPETKFEYVFSISFKKDHLSLYLEYENEYFEHYGFVDSNKNVWNEEFESGSIQRTKTLLFSIEYRLF